MTRSTPFDARVHATAGSLAPPRLAHRQRPVAIWLFAICGMLLVMVGLGGATRLSGSGLSIMEWAPVTGALPPLSHHAWEDLFHLYQAIPQYQLLHPGMELSGFQHIFWLEWVHRLWGRLIGVAVLLPLLWFWATGRIDRRLGLRMLLFFVLGGLQGAVGWFMVASGFEHDAIAVSPPRLVAHLTLALLLYAAILWTALGTYRPAPTVPLAPAARRLRGWLLGLLGVLSLTILAGGFTAGTHAGFEYNTFPLMDGHLVPTSYGRLSPFWHNIFQNVAAVQFDHRALATLTLLGALGVAIGGLRTQQGAVRAALLAVGGFALLQYALGVGTLLLVVPIDLAVTHQVDAVLLLSAVLVALHLLRPLRLGRQAGQDGAPTGQRRA